MSTVGHPVHKGHHSWEPEDTLVPPYPDPLLAEGCPPSSPLPHTPLPPTLSNPLPPAPRSTAVSPPPTEPGPLRSSDCVHHPHHHRWESERYQARGRREAEPAKPRDYPVMGSGLGGCQRVLRDDLRPSENTGERVIRRMGSSQDQECSIPGFSGQPWRTSE